MSLPASHHFHSRHSHHSRYPRPAVIACVTAAAFTDLMAYSAAVPVLPDYASRFNASPTTIGMLFASFGVTLLALSVPMGAVSDRLGRKGPMLAALIVLGLSTLLFAYARNLPMLFAARMLQGAADAMTWVIGFALIADLYGPEERGRVMGLVMSGTGLGLIAGPALGGWLYEIGGIRLPFLFVTALAGLNAVAFALVAPTHFERGASVPMRRVLAVPAILLCALAVVAGAATIAMLEPVLPLFFESRLGLRPAGIGALFGAAALASAVVHPIYGHLSDRWGAKRLMVAGLVLSAVMLPLINMAMSAWSAMIIMVCLWAVLSLIVTPSLAFMAQAASAAGLEAYGVVYGVYNVAWAAGLMVGPSLGGFLFERAGIGLLTAGWAAALFAFTVLLTRIQKKTRIR